MSPGFQFGMMPATQHTTEIKTARKNSPKSCCNQTMEDTVDVEDLERIIKEGTPR